MHNTTVSRESPFPDDDFRPLLQQLVRTGGLLEADPTPHDHGGVKVSVSEVFALGELVGADSLSQQDLGARLGLEKSTVSRLAAGMQERGWLVRERDPENRRYYRLGLTATGRDVAHRVGADLRARHADLIDRLTPAEREGLAVGLAGLVRVLAEHRREPHAGTWPRPGDG